MRNRVILASFLSLCWMLQGQQAENALKEAAAVRNFEGVVVSPDGKSVAWTERIRPRDAAIYVSETSGGHKPRRITAGDGTHQFRENALAWSPDSTKLAFLSDAGGRDQLDV